MELKYVSKERREEQIRLTALSAEVDAHKLEVEIGRLQVLLEKGIEGLTETEIEAAAARAMTARLEAVKLLHKVDRSGDKAKTWSEDVLRWRRGWIAGDSELGMTSWLEQNELDWVKWSGYSPDFMVAINNQRIRAGAMAEVLELGHGYMMGVLARLPLPTPKPEEVEEAEKVLAAAKAASPNGDVKVTAIKGKVKRG